MNGRGACRRNRLRNLFQRLDIGFHSRLDTMFDWRCFNLRGGLGHGLRPDRFRDGGGRRFFNRGGSISSRFNGNSGSRSIAATSAATGAATAGQAAANLQRHVVIKRTGMGFLVADAELGQEVQDHVRLNLQLPRQFVNANFTHRVTPCRKVHPRQG
jgi:hypothetical protein